MSFNALLIERIKFGSKISFRTHFKSKTRKRIEEFLKQEMIYVEWQKPNEVQFTKGILLKS